MNFFNLKPIFIRIYLSAKRLVVLVLLLTTLLFFNACQKTDSPRTEAQEVSVTDKVESWLNEQIAIRTPENADAVRQMKENLLLSQISYEKLNDKEQLIIIPISDKFVSKNNKDKPVTNYLLLILDEKNKIRKGNTVQYLSENKTEKSTIPKNSFHYIYNHQPVKGQFTFLSISDKYQYEQEYKDGRLYRFTIKTPNSTNSIIADADCTDWYLVTTITYPDGSTYQYSEYVGTTCTNGGDEEYLDPNNGGGSGPGGGEVTQSSKPAEWVVAETTSLIWHVKSYEVLGGEKVGSNPSRFTYITHNTSTLFNTPGGPNNASWQQLSAVPTLSGSNFIATSTVSGKVTTPDGDIPVNLKSKSWYAPNEFP